MTVGESTDTVLGDNRDITLQLGRTCDPEVNNRAGYISIVLPAGYTVTGDMAAQAAKKFEELQPQGLKPLLLDLTGVDSISRSARAVFGSSRAALAVAVLGATPVDRVIANFLLGGDAPSFPTKYFTRIDEAVAWLGTYANV